MVTHESLGTICRGFYMEAGEWRKAKLKNTENL
ncbi:hypothetical protein AMURIS_03371 [Acetatifactor muris]|uniref:Uncharacterized protein n=1 Tax=Acetatifactor muris TaxID=879566 RepID=A0A2K4ZJK0_9FIRM|nr:hypothetical protein AMURIS_03371 [Acetatifactor muris]